MAWKQSKNTPASSNFGRGKPQKEGKGTLDTSSRKPLNGNGTGETGAVIKVGLTGRVKRVTQIDVD